jgi:hypothetical protein
MLEKHNTLLALIEVRRSKLSKVTATLTATSKTNRNTGDVDKILDLVMSQEDVYVLSRTAQ